MARFAVMLVSQSTSVIRKWRANGYECFKKERLTNVTNFHAIVCQNP